MERELLRRQFAAEFMQFFSPDGDVVELAGLSLGRGLDDGNTVVWDGRQRACDHLDSLFGVFRAHLAHLGHVQPVTST
ncbi:hypothetical protein [Tropicimonas marinistellae]|uniref:hypothetical protein n=1 Tax=Tropicimonas marinistellae TaxID=1739787 RepID=UPI003F61BA6C